MTTDSPRGMLRLTPFSTDFPLKDLRTSCKAMIGFGTVRKSLSSMVVPEVMLCAYYSD